MTEDELFAMVDKTTLSTTEKLSLKASVEEYVSARLKELPQLLLKWILGEPQTNEDSLPQDVIQKLPSAEDIKRWHQLLVGIGEEQMLKDIEATFV